MQRIFVALVAPILFWAAVAQSSPAAEPPLSAETARATDSASVAEPPRCLDGAGDVCRAKGLARVRSAVEACDTHGPAACGVFENAWRASMTGDSVFEAKRLAEKGCAGREPAACTALRAISTRKLELSGRMHAPWVNVSMNGVQVEDQLGGTATEFSCPREENCAGLADHDLAGLRAHLATHRRRYPTTRAAIASADAAVSLDVYLPLAILVADEFNEVVISGGRK